MDEVVSAAHSGQNRLVAMGVRAALEWTMIQHVGDKGSFQANLTEFHEKGHITASHKEFMESVLEVGHAAIHRGYVPTNKDISTMLDIVGTLFNQFYFHPNKAKELKRAPPPRGKTPDKK